MKRYCDHEFHSAEMGIVVCIFCGQVRHIYPNGKVVIEVEEGKVEKNGSTTGQNN